MDRRSEPRPLWSRIAWLAVLVATTAGCRIEPTQSRPAAAPEDLRETVNALLDASADGWNRGDASTFLSIYEDAPTTTYVGSGGLIEGYNGISRSYASYFRDGAPSSRLRFEDLRTRALGDAHALATARYVLTDGESVTSGPFTLVLRRVEGRWRVIHDHSSADPPEPAAAEPATEAAARSAADDSVRTSS